MNKSLLTLAYEAKHPEEIYIPILMLVLLLLIVIALLVVLVQVGALYNAMQGGSWQDELRNWYYGQAGLTPMTAEKDLLLDHNYDGIQELDNHLPPWWKNLFYVTIVFGGIYLFMYHWVESWPLPAAEYHQELDQAQADKVVWEKTQLNALNETNVKVVKDAATLAEGKKLYLANCVACHGAGGGGGVGPNLTDPYWLHGGQVGQLFKTIKYGVAGKGMTAWQATLNPKQIQAVASYVLSLQGSMPAGGKAPQGQLEGAATAAAQ